MQTKLTLRMDSKLINGAKKIAAARGTSLSVMVSDFFRSLSDNYNTNADNPSPLLIEISGILPLKESGSAPSKEYYEQISEKYL